MTTPRTKKNLHADAPDEKEFLAKYRVEDFPRPSVTVDLVIMTIKNGALSLLLVERGEHPYKGMRALPGGFLRVREQRNGPKNDQGEDLEAAARRELAEETGIDDPRVYLQQIGAFGKPGRDPRTRVVSVAFVALVRPALAEKIRAGGDASAARFYEWKEIESAGHSGPKKLAFDHAEIISAALTFVRKEMRVSPIAFELTGAEFTVQDLRETYEIIDGEKLDPGNFRKRFLRMLEDGIVEETAEKRRTSSKPARVYRFQESSRAS